jgi:hypothetical protein
MIEVAIQALFIGLLSACVACVHSIVLWNANTPLNFLYSALRWIQDKWPMLANPLGACVLCFSGQLSLWSAIFLGGPWYMPLWSAGAGIIFAQYLSKAWENS